METIDLGIEGLDDIEEIGRGGSSRVYRAKQVELDRYVALKVLNAARADAEVAKRFDRERKAMGRLSLHEGIVPVYSSGLTDHGEPYLIMPYYADGSLQDRLEAGPVPWSEAVDFVAVAARTMAAAHEAGVVHLDLKPANIMLSGGAPRIADFGIAKLASEQAATTQTSDPPFTPSYSAPETLLEGTATPASDVYGLAATLWALIAGRSPFRVTGGDNSVMAVIGRAVHSPAADLRHLAPDAICAVIETGMSKQPSDRYPSAGAFAEALAEAVEEAGGSPASAVAAGSPDADTTIDESYEPEPGDAASGSRLIVGETVPPKFVPAGDSQPSAVADLLDRLPLAGIAVVTVVLVVGVVVLGLQLLSSNDPTGASTEATAATAESSSTTADGSQVGVTNLGDASSTAEPPEPSTSSEASSSSTTTPSTTGTTTSTPSSSATTLPTSTTNPTTTSSPSTTAATTTSATTSSVPTTPTTAPQLDPPQSVEATLGVGEVTISWDPPGGGQPVNYTVFRNGSSIGTTPGTSFVDSNPGLTPTVNEYRVRANGSGEPGDPASSELSAPASFL